MAIDRLTERARTALLGLPKKEKVTSGEVLDSLKKTSGMGEYLLKNISKLNLPKTRKVSIPALIKEAYYQSIKLKHPYVGTEHILLALVKLSHSADYNKVRVELIKQSILPNGLRTLDTKLKKTPLLDTFGINLNSYVMSDISRNLVYRDVYESLVSALLLKNTPNILLVGDAGVGKKSLVDYLAQNIATMEVPSALAGTSIIEFDILAFMTNVFNKGGMDTGLTQLTDELKSLDRQVIIYIKNFQNIFYAASGVFTIPLFYSMFKSAVSSAGVRMIAALNSNLFDKIFIENEHVIDDFTVIEIGEPSQEDTIRILNSAALHLSSYHNVMITPEVVKHIYNKAKEMPGTLKFPQRGVDLMDHCCTYALLKKSRIPQKFRNLVDNSEELLNSIDDTLSKGDYDAALTIKKSLKKNDKELSNLEESIFGTQKRIKLTSADVDQAFSAFKDERTDNAGKPDISKLSDLTSQLKKRIIGQDKAVETVVKSLIRARLGLRGKKRPLGNFMFLGPTGVGKTELAKVLADAFFGDKSLIRLDMSDFSEKHNIARLVGAPPGYVGYGEGGELTSKIETNPDSVVLFDEIEKAHPDVLNILLQIMDEGELTDAKGNTFDFSRSVVILTSNLGTEILSETGIGFDEKRSSDKNIENRLRNNVKKIIKPELINRFDEIIIFNRLAYADQLRILNLLIKDITTNLSSQKVILKVATSVKEKILKAGFTEEYGARGLRRTLEKELLDPIAEHLLKHSERPLKIKVSLKNKEIILS